MSMYSKNAPYELPVKRGETVYICQCGHTNTPPLCDGSHNNYPGKSPLAHTADADGAVYVCGCGKTTNAPWCDGSHNANS